MGGRYFEFKNFRQFRFLNFKITVKIIGFKR
nr:MAG TPA: Receptor-binding protein of phage tail base-plate Siphoviridae, head [Caudoviricetes sp.]